MAWESPDRQGPGLEWLWVQVSWSEIRVSETHWSEWRQYSGGSEWDGVQVSEESVVTKNSINIYSTKGSF